MGSRDVTGESGVKDWDKSERGHGLGQVREGSRAGTGERGFKGWDN